MISYAALLPPGTDLKKETEVDAPALEGSLAAARGDAKQLLGLICICDVKLVSVFDADAGSRAAESGEVRGTLSVFGRALQAVADCIPGEVDSLQDPRLALARGAADALRLAGHIATSAGPEIGHPAGFSPDCYQESTQVGPPAGPEAPAAADGAEEAYQKLLGAAAAGEVRKVTGRLRLQSDTLRDLQTKRAAAEHQQRHEDAVQDKQRLEKEMAELEADMTKVTESINNEIERFGRHLKVVCRLPAAARSTAFEAAREAAAAGSGGDFEELIKLLANVALAGVDDV